MTTKEQSYEFWALQWEETDYCDESPHDEGTWEELQDTYKKEDIVIALANNWISLDGGGDITANRVEESDVEDDESIQIFFDSETMAENINLLDAKYEDIYDHVKDTYGIFKDGKSADVKHMPALTVRETNKNISEYFRELLKFWEERGFTDEWNDDDDYRINLFRLYDDKGQSFKEMVSHWQLAQWMIQDPDGDDSDDVILNIKKIFSHITDESKRILSDEETHEWEYKIRMSETWENEVQDCLDGVAIPAKYPDKKELFLFWAQQAADLVDYHTNRQIDVDSNRAIVVLGSRAGFIINNAIEEACDGKAMRITCDTHLDIVKLLNYGFKLKDPEVKTVHRRMEREYRRREGMYLSETDDDSDDAAHVVGVKRGRQQVDPRISKKLCLRLSNLHDELTAELANPRTAAQLIEKAVHKMASDKLDQ